ncbi:MAG: hypothetical protein H6807_15980 [Planctomycetes bacterium]|nr:hypothetical protein [Planctomycetota bacterium]
MEIVSIGQRGYQAALGRAEQHAQRIVENGAEVDDLIGLKIAENQAKTATKVIKVGLEVEDSLLDILA